VRVDKSSDLGAITSIRFELVELRVSERESGPGGLRPNGRAVPVSTQKCLDVQPVRVSASDGVQVGALGAIKLSFRGSVLTHPHSSPIAGPCGVRLLRNWIYRSMVSGRRGAQPPNGNRLQTARGAMSEQHKVATVFGTVTIRRASTEEITENRLRFWPWRTTYALTGHGIEGHVNVDPLFADTRHTDLFLPAETVRDLVPTRFSVHFGQHGSNHTINGSPIRTDGILTIDGLQMLSAGGLALDRRGDTREFTVRQRTGAWAHAEVSALAAAKTQEVIRAVIQVHEADEALVRRMDRLYARGAQERRRKQALQDLRQIEQLSRTLQQRAERLRSYLAESNSLAHSTDADSAARKA
jgi:hypothetical protein